MYYVTPRESSRLFEKGKNYLVLDHLHGQGGSFQLIVVAEDSTIQAQDYDLFSYVGPVGNMVTGDWNQVVYDPQNEGTDVYTAQEKPAQKRKPGRPKKQEQ